MFHLLFFTILVYFCQGLDPFICYANTDAIKTSAQHVETEKRLRALELQVQQLQKLVQKQKSNEFSTIDGIPQDCQEIYENDTKQDGIYSISPDGRCPFFVYCDMTNGGWTVMQRRVGDHVNFYRGWNEYVTGFGDLDGSFWIGLEKLHRLTRDGSQIYFDMENYDGSKEYAHYKVFTVHAAATAYTMNVDAFGYAGSIKELLSYHSGMKFSTYDRDNDLASDNCVRDRLDGGAWWHNNCWRLGNFNGIYGKLQEGGIAYWITSNVPIKNVAIKFKRLEGTC